MNADLAFGLVVLVVAAGYYAAALGIPASLLDDVVGSRGLPTVYAAALTVLALIQVASALVRRSRRGRSTGDLVQPIPAKTLGLLLLGVGYGALLPWLGYAASIGMLLGATAAHQGAGFSRRVLAMAVLGAAGMWGLFVWLLGIPQPDGIWSSF